MPPGVFGVKISAIVRPTGTAQHAVNNRRGASHHDVASFEVGKASQGGVDARTMPMTVLAVTSRAVCRRDKPLRRRAPGVRDADAGIAFARSALAIVVHRDHFAGVAIRMAILPGVMYLATRLP